MKKLLLPFGLAMIIAGTSIIAFAKPGNLAASKPTPNKSAEPLKKDKKKLRKETQVADWQKHAKKIDALVEAKLAEKEIQPNALADDATFLRRIYLDIAGRVPTIEEAEDFHADLSSSKRDILIDKLLASDAYTSRMYNYWADVLRLLQKDGVASTAYQLWLKESLRDNKPYDQMVREMVSAKGMAWENGAIGYYMRDRGMPLDNMSNTVRTFLGVRLECAQCHDHPFDDWTQMDYYKMAAFTYGMDTRNYNSENLREANNMLNEEKKEAFEKAAGKNIPVLNEQRLKQALESDKYDKIIARHGMTKKEFKRRVEKGIAATEEKDKELAAVRRVGQRLFQPLRYIQADEKEKSLKLPHDYQYADADPHEKVGAVTMFGDAIDVENIDSLAEAYADWMTSPDNPTFTRVISNRLWKHVYGMGIFEPIDQITSNMRISNEPLLEHIEKLMVEVDYDMKAFLKVLYSTKTYQREACRDEIALGEVYYFQGPILRRMSAEQIWDSVVALAIPGADSYRPRLKSQLASIQKAKLTYESLEEPTAEEFYASMKKWAPQYAEAQERAERLRKQLATAMEKGQKDKVAQLRREISTASRNAERKIQAEAYTKLPKDGKEKNVLAAAGMQERKLTNNTDAGATMSMMNDQPVVFTELPKPKFPTPPTGLDKNERKRWEQRQKIEYSQYKNLVSKMARAAELESPARPGHFLREFGQSDRELIENSSSAASIPQALNLLNGPIVEALVNPFAVFGSRLHAAGDDEEKIEMIFQAMLTREPRPDEVKACLAEIEKSGDRAYEGIVWALLNTRQFMFVQ
ncbi:MAG: DUF1549 domain-containing protein [Verrucomicrobiota bacterium]